MSEGVVLTLRAVIAGDEKSWVLFQHGTCVIVMEPDPDLESQAVELLKVWGPAQPGASAGDFSTIDLGDDAGWVVTSHHKDIFTYVAPDEAGADPTELSVGMYGRFKRGEDAASLTVVHVEDKRLAL
ncbi:MAG: hypothetical protein AAF458_23795 [Pseudomonadota bacterium]